MIIEKVEAKYVNEATDRKILSGCDKPISPHTFYRLRDAGHFSKFAVSGRRFLYSIEELHNYICSTKEIKSV